MTVWMKRWMGSTINYQTGLVSKNEVNTRSDKVPLHPDFSEEGKEERPAGHVGVFCQNLGITRSIYFGKLFQFLK